MTYPHAIRRIAATLALLLVLIHTPAAAQDVTATAYASALARAEAGQWPEALDELGDLAEAVPASVPVHRALALTALAAGEETASEWNDRFYQRLRRSRRDVGASVGRAILLAAEDRVREAHSLLSSAILSGARHPLLVPLLIETSPDPGGLPDWARRRARALGDDPDFEAFRVRILMETGRTDQAAEIVEDTFKRHPQNGDLLALSTLISWASGRERRACEQATLALGFLDDREEVPDVRVPRRAWLARALVACGRTGDAQTVISSMSPLAVPPGAARLEPVLRAVTAELALAQGRLVESLTVARERDVPAPPPAPWDETLRSVTVRARAAAGLPVDFQDLLPAPGNTHPITLADRALALATVAAFPHTWNQGVPLTSAPFTRLSRLTLANGLDVRGVRLGLLARLLEHDEHDEEAGRSLDDLLAVIGDNEGHTSISLAAAARIVRTRSAFRAGDGDGVLELTEVPTVQRAGAPGALLAPLRIARARAALAAGRAQMAREAVEEGLLDLQSADLENDRLPDELLAFGQAFGDPGLVLPGYALRAALAHGADPNAATASYLEALDRTARTWSILGLPGTRSPGSLADQLPEAGCLLLGPPDVSTSGRTDLLVRLSPGRPAEIGPSKELLATAPCAQASTVFWLGPGRPPGGLTLAPGKVLVRWIGPRPAKAREEREPPTVSAPDVGPAWLGPGPDRPLRRTVESIVGQEAADRQPDALDVAQVRLYGWPLHVGAGLASSSAPLASGWLVPPGAESELGWLTPEAMPAPRRPAEDGSPVPGLVALGLEATPDATNSERGLWLLAEAAIDSGWEWALLSRRPLTDRELRELEGTWPDWRRDPVSAARQLAERQPELAGALTLWSAPGRLPLERTRWWLLLALAGAVVAGTVLLLTRSWWPGAVRRG